MLSLSERSVAVAVKLWLPFANPPVVKDHCPLAFVVAVPNCVELSNILIVLFASAVPVSVTALKSTVSPEITGGAGGV